MTKASALHQAILEAWDCAFHGARVAYLSGPLTTGLRQVERIRAGDNSRDDKTAIFRENSDALIATAQKLRAERFETIVEPASLNVENWSQADYLHLWELFIERHVRLILFMPDWEYSVGCATEFARAIMHDVRTETVSGSLISAEDGIALLTTARDDLVADDAGGNLRELGDGLSAIIDRLNALVRPAEVSAEAVRKDASLDRLAERGFNVAQFVSFAPERGRPRQQFSRIAGHDQNHRFASLAEAVQAVLARSADQSVNVRSFEPFNSQSREFVYGLKTVDEAVGTVERLTGEGLHTIINETVDIHDGGVSGVLLGNVLEFAPDATPRCVEEPGTASLPRGWGRELLSTVYRFPVELAVPLGSRLEFSLHPKPRGWKQTNILVWEYEERPHVDAHPRLEWPNIFSRMIGDKVYGLLVAHHIGLPVPQTTVINRRVAPFSFGRPTKSGETWIRTAPAEQMPGRLTTHRGWIDPYALLQSEDPTGCLVPSVVSQEGIRPIHSGAFIVGANGQLIMEGKKGEGESLMIGASTPQRLPRHVESDVRSLFNHAEAVLGPVRFEWVHDGERAWVVQLHRGATETDSEWIMRGPAERWVSFHRRQGLERLRSLIDEIGPGVGLCISGKIGLTSHMADVIRRAKVPAKMVNEEKPLAMSA